jgi:GNAT superfamily N-acetyltransferase
MSTVNQIDEHQEGDFIVSTDPKRLDRVFTYQWLANEAYWSQGLPFNVFKRMVDHSLCFGVYYRTGKQVGFGRVITDYTTFAWLTDVFIIDEYRGKGLSVFLMNCILGHPELKILRRWLLGTDQAHGLYRKFGFGELDHPENFLTLHHSQMYTSGKFDDLIFDFFKGAKNS